MVREMEQNRREAVVRGKRRVSPQPHLPPEDLEAFFRECDKRHGPDPEPDWEEHLAVMEKSRRGGMSGR